VCGDGVLCEETEFCDDHANSACGPCNATCSGPGSGRDCNDGQLCEDEETDVDCGFLCGPCELGQRCANDVDCFPAICVGPDARCGECGDGELDAGERCDGAAGVPPGGPIRCYDGARVNACRLDLSNVHQLFCQDSCSWSGGLGCDQSDADVLCGLLTGWPGSSATNYAVAPADHAPGFACPGFPLDGEVISLGAMPEYGVSLEVRYATTSLFESHGPGEVVRDVHCTLPTCGNEVREGPERCDGTDGVPRGRQIVCLGPEGATPCRYDFGGVMQLFCDGACSWGGEPGCDEFEADVFCRLKLGRSDVHAVSFTLSAPRDEPGFDCPTLGNGANLGPISEYGVQQPIRYNPVSVARSHSGATQEAVISGVECEPL
jgi:hypothetical protein